ncbi:unnamed protein product [Ilex paraguariensis]|uniref:Uncharacterized protein n=1 Tax=Ilex paraguariensis TaxID=185542 RepID=A0ABC8RX99_9AQUA
MADADIKPEVHKLIHDLVLHIHKNEPDIEKSILVFLPTYYSLEQQWFLLKPFNTAFKVHILHSSIDTDQALNAMKICKSRCKVNLSFRFFFGFCCPDGKRGEEEQGMDANGSAQFPKNSDQKCDRKMES